MKNSLIFLSCAMTIALLGCGGAPSDQPELGQVSGTVTLDGKPLPNANVTFEAESGRPSIAKTDEQGHYELTYLDNAKGAVVGTHVVRITTALDGPPPANYTDPIPRKYNEESTLRADVKAGENPPIDFELKTE